MIKLFLKKYIAELLSLTPILGFLLLIGAILFLIKKKDWALKVYLTSTVLFFLGACNPIVDSTLYSIENKFPPLKISEIKHKEIPYIVILAGGMTVEKNKSLITQVSPQTLGRLTEGVSIASELTQAKVIVSGLKEAESMREIAISLGLAPERIITDKESHNTYTHTKYLKPILKDSPFILVTSALHMPRSMGYFTKAGLNPIPAPTQFILKGPHSGLLSNIHIYPKGENLDAWDKISYELWGYIVGVVQGRI